LIGDFNKKVEETKIELERSIEPLIQWYMALLQEANSCFFNG
jgi:hypothetical protein